MNIEDYREIAAPIVTAGYENNDEPDNVRMSLMMAGVPYSAINAVYRGLAIDMGYLVDPKVVTAELMQRIEQVNWKEVETYEDFSKILDQLVADVDGATDKRAGALARKYAKEELEIELPKKPKGVGGKGRVGDVAKTVANLFRSNKTPTKQEFYDALSTVVGGDRQHENIMYYVGMHLAAGISMCNDIDIVDVVADLAKQPAPTGVSEGFASEEEDEAEEDMAA